MSGVAPPMQQQVYQQPPPMGVSQQPPVPLTTGMPDPATIEKQKHAYNHMLDEQLKQGVTVLNAQVQHQKEYLGAQAEQQKKQFNMQIEMEVKQQEMALHQQYAEQTMALQQQASQQKAALEQQAMTLTMEFQQKRAEEEMQKQQYEMERHQNEMQTRMQQEMAKLGVQAPLMPMGGMDVTNPGMQFGQFAAPQQPPQFAPQSSGQAPVGQYNMQPTATYVYGPNGELIPKEEAQQQQGLQGAPQ